MFTSRAEYRLALRSDNADARLTPLGREFGVVDDARWRRYCRKRELIDICRRWLNATRHNGRPVAYWLTRTEADWKREIDLSPWRAGVPADRAGNEELAAGLAEAEQAAVIEARYDGYLKRQDRQVERFRKLESHRIPEGFDFASIRELRREAREKLSAVAPRSIGQAQRISGISPADIAVVMIHLERRRRLAVAELATSCHK